jgi:hypothetical protein
MRAGGSSFGGEEEAGGGGGGSLSKARFFFLAFNSLENCCMTSRETILLRAISTKPKGVERGR